MERWHRQVIVLITGAVFLTLLFPLPPIALLGVLWGRAVARWVY
jgi:hypothetical protein